MRFCAYFDGQRPIETRIPDAAAPKGGQHQTIKLSKGNQTAYPHSLRKGGHTGLVLVSFRSSLSHRIWVTKNRIGKNTNATVSSRSKSCPSPQHKCYDALQARSWPIFWLMHWGRNLPASVFRLPSFPVTGFLHEYKLLHIQQRAAAPDSNRIT